MTDKGLLLICLTCLVAYFTYIDADIGIFICAIALILVGLVILGKA